LLRRPFKRKFETDLRRRRLYVFGGLIISVTQFFPVIGTYAIDATCFRTTQRNAEPISATVETFQQDNGDYPIEINSLVPEYLSEIPEPECSW